MKTFRYCNSGYDRSVCRFYFLENEGVKTEASINQSVNQKLRQGLGKGTPSSHSRTEPRLFFPCSQRTSFTLQNDSQLMCTKCPLKSGSGGRGVGGPHEGGQEHPRPPRGTGVTPQGLLIHPGERQAQVVGLMAQEPSDTGLLLTRKQAVISALQISSSLGLCRCSLNLNCRSSVF